MKKVNEINEKLIKVLEEKIQLLEEQKVINQKIIEIQKEQLFLSGVSKWQFLATTMPEPTDKYYTVLDKYGNIEENVLFGCSGFMNEPYSFFEGKKIASKDIIVFC